MLLGKICFQPQKEQRTGGNIAKRTRPKMLSCCLLKIKAVTKVRGLALTVLSLAS